MNRTLAPFDRRLGQVEAVDAVGAYRRLRCTDPGGPAPRPGQFYMLAMAERWGGGEDERPYLPRAFSYLRWDAGRLEFLLEDVGPGTRRLAEARPGEEIWLLGPLGAGFTAPRDGRAPLLVGGGIGIVPLLPLQSEIPGPALLGFRDAAHATAGALMEDVELCTDDGSAGHHGLVTELLGARLDGHVEIYACGPPAMLEAVRLMTGERGVPAQLALESGMACGFGACFGCVVPTADGYVRVCVDGPVLEAARLEAVPAH
ncbi:MAG TPA: dihydroorotate dehydrogenase electron transfer subunit [Solirubrobacteraceae bacterium]|nr:dihydroorotate dehydrogenase electron transfer subunit [Solirubrobacteraceae bacterium]